MEREILKKCCLPLRFSLSYARVCVLTLTPLILGVFLRHMNALRVSATKLLEESGSSFIEQRMRVPRNDTEIT